MQFYRGCYEEQLCEIFLNLGKWFRRNIHVKLHEIWTSGSGDVGLIHFLSRALAAQPLCSVHWNQLCNFGRRHH